MPTNRRGFLAVLACTPALAVAACTPDPTIEGGPAQAYSPTPTAPLQSPEAKRASSAVSTLQATVAAAAAGTWPEAPAGWAAGLVAVGQQCTAHLDRLLSADPLVSEQERTFEAPAAAAPALTSYAAANQALAEVTKKAVAELSACVTRAESQPLRLLYASLASATRAAAAPALAGAPGPGSPIRFPDTTPEASVVVALSHVWALVNGLEIGLGRLPAKDPLRPRGTARLDQVRQLRLDLRDAMAKPAEQDVAYELPNRMRTAGEIIAGWAALELGVLDGLARLVAASPAESAPWLSSLLGQVGHVQAWGGKLPVWPGWVST